MSMKIHQMTDLHIPRDDAEDFRHIRGYVQRQLKHVEATAPDLLVISGDLTMDDAWEPAYQVDLDADVFVQQAFQPSVREITVEAGVVASRLVEV